MTEEKLLDLHDLAKRIASKKGFPDLSEDFAQQVVLHCLNYPESHPSIEFLFIDYLRTQFGRTRSYYKGRLVEKKSRLQTLLSYENSIFLKKKEAFQLPYEFDLSIYFTDIAAKKVYELFLQDFSIQEIARTVKVNPSRISQILHNKVIPTLKLIYQNQDPRKLISNKDPYKKKYEKQLICTSCQTEFTIFHRNIKKRKTFVCQDCTQKKWKSISLSRTP